MIRTPFTDLLGLAHPVVAAPMAHAGDGRLAAAVSAAGGLGMVPVAGSSTPEWVAQQAAAAREPDRPFGIGLLAWTLPAHPELVDAALAAGPALVSVSFGDLRPWVGRLREAGTTVAAQVGDLAEARAAVDAGAQVLVARGAEGGGHGRDAVATLPLLAAVLDAVDVPVLAAGGIASARGLAAVLAAGAAGAWCGTAFLGCPETLLDPSARARLLAAEATDTVYARVFDVGLGVPWPARYGGRSLRTPDTDRWAGREDALAGDETAKAAIRAARKRGEVQYAGQAVGLLRAERPAGQVVAEMVAGAEALLGRWGRPGG